MPVTKGNLALLLFSVVMALIMSELLLRAIGYYGYREADLGLVREVDDEILDHRREPGSVWVLDTVEFAANSAGWRDVDHEIGKPSGKRRLLILGDSIVEGYGVPFEETFGQQLSRLIESEETEAWEVIVLAMAGLNTRQEAHILATEGVSYDPDLIVVGYSLNDPERGVSFRKLEETRQREGVFPRLKRQLRRSSLAYLLYSSGQRFAWRVRLILGREETAEYLTTDYFSTLHADPKAWEGVETGLDSIRAEAARLGATVVVVIFPGIADIEPYAWEESHRKVAEAARAKGFEVIDLTEAFAPLSQSELQVESGDHIHPNARGHRIAAEETFQWLQREGLLDRAAPFAGRSVEGGGIGSGASELERHPD